MRGLHSEFTESVSAPYPPAQMVDTGGENGPTPTPGKQHPHIRASPHPAPHSQTPRAGPLHFGKACSRVTPPTRTFWSAQMFLVCTVQETSHQPHVALELLKCGVTEDLNISFYSYL